MLKRTVVVGDANIINRFKATCKENGMIMSKVVIKLMKQYVTTERAITDVTKRRTKKTKNLPQ